MVTAVDRSGGEFNQVLNQRRDVTRVLRRRLAPGSVLFTDGFHAYRRVALEAATDHVRFRQNHPEDLDHASLPWDENVNLGLGRVNAHHERIKTFVNRRARGVSTKHLENYLV